MTNYEAALAHYEKFDFTDGPRTRADQGGGTAGDRVLQRENAWGGLFLIDEEACWKQAAG